MLQTILSPKYPSKLMETRVASNIIDHVVIQNLLDDRQWAYAKEKSIEQLVIQITEKWRIAVDRKLLVGILFVAFTRAFDTVSHNIFLQSCMILKSEEIYGCG